MPSDREKTVSVERDERSIGSKRTASQANLDIQVDAPPQKLQLIDFLAKPLSEICTSLKIPNFALSTIEKNDTFYIRGTGKEIPCSVHFDMPWGKAMICLTLINYTNRSLPGLFLNLFKKSIESSFHNEITKLHVLLWWQKIINWKKVIELLGNSLMTISFSFILKNPKKVITLQYGFTGVFVDGNRVTPCLKIKDYESLLFSYKFVVADKKKDSYFAIGNGGNVDNFIEVIKKTASIDERTYQDKSRIIMIPSLFFGRLAKITSNVMINTDQYIFSLISVLNFLPISEFRKILVEKLFRQVLICLQQNNDPTKMHHIPVNCVMAMEL